MAVTYGFFNSINGDRTYDADQMSEYFNGLVSNGVYESVGNGLQVLAGTGMTVEVQSGRGLINCKWLSNNSVLTLDITSANAILNRYTAIVLRLDIVNRLMTITTKDGTAASSPVKPTMQNDASMVELCLAYVYVGAAVTSISQSNIEDMRGSSLCGWVTGLIQQVDTSQLFLQYQTAYEEQYQAFEQWFADLTEELRVDTYVESYNKQVTLAGSSTTISLDMTGYSYSSDDIIEVYINGLMADASSDYTLDTSGSTPTVTPVATKSGTVVDIKVIKSIIGYTS